MPRNKKLVIPIIEIERHSAKFRRIFYSILGFLVLLIGITALYDSLSEVFQKLILFLIGLIWVFLMVMGGAMQREYKKVGTLKVLQSGFLIQYREVPEFYVDKQQVLFRVSSYKGQTSVGPNLIPIEYDGLDNIVRVVKNSGKVEEFRILIRSCRTYKKLRKKGFMSRNRNDRGE